MNKSSGFHIKGLEAIEKAIKEKYSSAKSGSIQRGTVNQAGDLIVEALKTNYQKALGKYSKYSKGHTVAEVMRSDARTKNNIVQSKVGWHGDADRWRLIHLEEWGYVRSGKQYKPPSVGVIDKTLREIEKEYEEIIRKGLMEFL